MINKLLKKFVNILIVLIIPVFTLAQDFEVAPAIIFFNAEPGQSQTAQIIITNHSNEKSSFTATLHDFIINKEGNFVDMPAGKTEHSLAKWIHINPVFVEINPNEAKQVTVSIQPPTGDYSTRWANIYIKSTKEQTALVADKNLRAAVVVEGQIAVKVLQSPKSNINYKMKITGLTEITTAQDTTRRFKALVDNFGDKITNCKIIFLASNLSTSEEKKITEFKFTSYPDSQREIIMTVSKNALPPGKYALAMILDYGKQSNLEGTQMIINVD